MGLGAQHLARAVLPEGSVVWAPGPVRTGSEYFAPTGIQSPDRPARLAART